MTFRNIGIAAAFAFISGIIVEFGSVPVSDEAILVMGMVFIGIVVFAWTTSPQKR